MKVRCKESRSRRFTVGEIYTVDGNYISSNVVRGYLLCWESNKRICSAFGSEFNYLTPPGVLSDKRD